MLDVVILAAGKGTRMRSNLPKVLHTLAGKPFLQHVLDRTREIDAAHVYVVVGHGAEAVKNAVQDSRISFIEQTQQLGTGHAVQQALPYFSEDSVVLILYGDVPLISSKTLKQLLAKVDDGLALLTVNLPDPTGYGRIVRDATGKVVAIVEQKDADSAQQNISEVNTGVMAVRGGDLLNWLPLLSADNAQQEYLLTDIIAIAHQANRTIYTAQPESASEVMGVNDRQQQAQLEREHQATIAASLMRQGLTLMDPARFDCRGSLSVGQDCIIDVNCVFEGDCVLGDNVVIGPNCHIIASHIGNDVEIKSHSVLENASLGNRITVGPFARLRPQTELADDAKIGNFVEIKKAKIGKGSKVNHLSYIGDAEVGEQVNIGAGTITCNYDGANKFVTTIGDGVFVGSNTAIVAPVTLGENVTVGAGSVITSDVADGSLAVARSRQKNIPGWERPVKKGK